MMSEPIKLYSFNADKSYLLAYGSSAADGSGTLEKLLKQSKQNLISLKNDDRKLPFILSAGIGNDAVYIDKIATRFYFILQADDNSYIINGLNTNALNAIKNSTQFPEEPYNKIKVKNGDYFCISPNVPYSLSEGISYIECSSSSSKITLIDSSAILSDLIFQKAAPLLKKPPFHNEYNGFSVRLLTACESYSVAQISIAGEYNNNVSDYSFKCLFCLDGGAEMKYANKKIKLNSGDCYFLPAGMGEFSISGGIELLSISK